jgi:hypothetical protein
LFNLSIGDSLGVSISTASPPTLPVITETFFCEKNHPKNFWKRFYQTEILISEKQQRI